MLRVTTFLLVDLKLVGNSMLGAVVADRGAGNVVRNSVRFILILTRATKFLQPKRTTAPVVPLNQVLIKMIIAVEGIIVIVRRGGKV